MSEIKRSDIISDDALMAPLILAKNLEEAVRALDKVIQKGRGHLDTLEKGGGSALKTGKAIKDLTLEQKELFKIQNSIRTTIARTNTTYQSHAKELQKVRDQYKDKLKLGDADAKQISKQNASINQLSAALTKNRRAYAELRSEEERNSKEGKELLSIIQQQDKELKELMASTGKHQLNVGNYAGAVSGLKGELKAARDEMAGIAATLGITSPEYQEAAVKAGGLANALKDVKDNSKIVSGEPLEKMGKSADLLKDKLLALDFKGATMAVKQFARASNELTFRQAIRGMGEFVRGLGQMAKAILTNPIFLLAATIAGLVIAINKLKNSLIPLRILFGAIGDGADYLIGKLKELSDWMGLSRFAAEEAAIKQIEANKKAIESLEDRYNREIELASRTGKGVVALEQRKTKEVIAYYSASLAAYDDLQKGHRELTEEEIADVEAITKAREEANHRLTVLELDAIEERMQILINKAEIEMSHERNAAGVYLRIIDDKVKRGNISVERGELRKQKILRESAVKQLEIELSLQQSLVQAALTTEQQAEALARIHEIRTELSSLATDAVLASNEEMIMSLDNLRRYYESFASEIGNLFSTTSDDNIAAIDAQLKATEASFKKQMEMAGDNAERKKELENELAKQREQLERKRITEQRRSAQFEKATAYVQALINTALAAVKALPNIPLSIASVALGGIQAAAISSKQIPSYQFGTDHHPGGPARVSEVGPELVIPPAGFPFLTPSGETIMPLPEGSQVIPHEDTMRALAMASLTSQMNGERHDGDDTLHEIAKGIRSLEWTVKNKKEMSFNISRKGAEIMIANAETRTRILNDVYR